jgi:hypothetical protein
MRFDSPLLSIALDRRPCRDDCRILSVCLVLFQMRLVITRDYAEMAEWSARYIRKRINDFQPGPDRLFVLGFPTGTW